MLRILDRVFARYGTKAVLHTADGQQEVRVFFESVNSKAKQNLQAQYHALGKLPGGQYICRFPAATAVAAGDWFCVNGHSYLVCRVEELLMAGRCAYRWALCTGKGGEDTWR